MKNSFRRLLACLEIVGIFVQRIVQKLLFLLIGAQALDWSLATLPQHDVDFKEQRSKREITGFCALYFFQLPMAAFDPSPAYPLGLETSIWFFSIIGTEVILFVVAILFRRNIEK